MDIASHQSDWIPTMRESKHFYTLLGTSYFNGLEKPGTFGIPNHVNARPQHAAKMQESFQTT